MRTRWTALWAALAASAVLAGCQSATKTNLAEYESLVARRRNPAPSATPMAVRAAQEKAEAEARAAEARAREAEARAKKAEAEAAAAKEKAAEAEKAAARRAREKALAEQKAEAERSAAEARKAAEAERKAREAAGKEASKQAAKEAQRRAAEEQKAAERRAEEERKAREAAGREAAAAVEVVAPPEAAGPALPTGRGETPLGGNTAYVLAVGDAVQIILRGIPGGEAIEDIIDEGGYVTLPLINEVLAAGCTATQLEKSIRDTYRERRIYKDINVQVMVPTRFYYMQGEIRGPGRVQLVSAVRLSQAIAANGGGTEFWNGKVVVKRNDGRVVNVKNARRLERTPEEDILLEPGDIVELKRGWL